MRVTDDLFQRRDCKNGEGLVMLKNKQRLLEFLRTELKAIESKHYGASGPQPWRARLVFEDSPCCLNSENRGSRVPCEECALMELVPEDRRKEKVPCRFIQLNANGDTVDSLYRCGTQQELETALAGWLRKAIHEIEAEAGNPELARH
jgi:hypothetical protein